MVMEEQPGKLSEAFRLFLQGQGYGMSISSISINFIHFDNNILQYKYFIFCNFNVQLI